MHLDFTVIKNESLVKFEKVLKNVRANFEDHISLILDTTQKDLDNEKRDNLELALSEMLGDEFRKYELSYIACMIKVTKLLEDSLNC